MSLSHSGKRPQTAPGLPAWGRMPLQNMESTPDGREGISDFCAEDLELTW